MDLLKRFVGYLDSQKNNASKATIKNYRADIAQLIRWYESEFNKQFNPNDITPQIIKVYKKSKTQDKYKKLSFRSLERHLSSLRKFFHFLKIEGIISKNPFESISNSLKNVSSNKDKWHLSEFKNYLYVYNLAYLTIKNYVIDVKQFFGWLEQVTGINNSWDVREKNVFEKVNPMLINEYKERLLSPRNIGGVGLSPKTINRKLSSLRKYLAFAQEEKLINTDSLGSQIENEKIERRHAEFISASRQVGIPTSRDDTKAVTPTRYSRFPPLRLLQKTTNGIIFILDSLMVLPLAKAIEQVKYLAWKIKGRPLFHRTTSKHTQKNADSHILSLPKSFYAPLSISTRYFPLHKKAWHHVRHTRPKWYKKYHSYPVAHYFHLAILVILMSAIGFTLYNDFINRAQNKSVLSAHSYEPRILAFNGRLTDSLDTPITSPNTPLRVSIYNDPVASYSALLWEEVVSVNPNQDGIFQTSLGKNTLIAQGLFQNPSLWLGISIGQTAELIPRQQLATASLAVNSQTLQGMPAITDPSATTRNVILALDSSGNLNIGGSATPVFQATSGQFTLSGKVLLLTTVLGSNSDVVISPDGLGKIDLEKPLQNTSNNNNIPSAIGAVEVDDLLAVLATSSGQSALTINQDGTGPIISASSSGTAKFTLDNIGNIISAKGANWQPTFDSANGLNIASASGTPFVTFDTLTSRVGIGTVIPQTTLDIIGTFRASSDITLSKFISNGGILYTNASGLLTQVAAGGSTQCLLGGTTPKFGECLTVTGGNVGIGTTNPLFKLDIQDSKETSAAAQIFNTSTGTDADGLIVKLGNTSTTTVSTTNHFLSLETSGIGIVGSVRGNGAKGVLYETSGIADFAEYFKKDENQEIEYGSVVCLDENGLAVLCDNNNIKVIGIASEHPSFLGGENLGKNKSIAVGLMGQVYARVSTKDGAIKPGDPLRASSIPGVAVKAIKPGQIVGKALEQYNGVTTGKILVSVSVSWYDPDVYLTDTGQLSITSQQFNNSTIQQSSSQSGQIAKLLNGYIVKNTAEQIVKRIGAFAQIAVANLQVGFLKAEEVTTNSLAVTTDSVTIAGQTLKEYIAQVVNNLAIQQFNNKVISPIAEIDEVRTNLISPLASHSLKIHLSTQSSKLIVENASGSAVATIDSSGNASFSGTLSSKQLEVDNDATVGGTLRARKILAENIEGLDAKVSTLAADYIQNTQKTLSASMSDSQTVRLSDPSADGLISPIPSDFPSVTSFPNGNLTSSFGTFTNGLMSFGPTSLAETAIAGPLYIQGTLILADNSINVLGNDLQLQPFRQGGISILSGLIKIDENGNLKVQGNAEFAKDVSIKGDLVASGSGTFRKLNLSLVQPALALSQTEIIATGSAGVAGIKAHQTEVTIINQLISDKSLIYITPVGTPSAQSPFLMRQTLGESFTVGVQTPTPQDTLFNWLIVN